MPPETLPALSGAILKGAQLTHPFTENYFTSRNDKLLTTCACALGCAYLGADLKPRRLMSYQTPACELTDDDFMAGASFTTSAVHAALLEAFPVLRTKDDTFKEDVELLDRHYPGVYTLDYGCPTLAHGIIRRNDLDQMPREKIAAWVKSLGH